MTRNKHVKQLVRTRMEKTGERYSAARRHVVAATPVPPDIAPATATSPARWHHAGTVAGATALRILLEAAGLRDPRTGRPLSEAMTFGLAGGMGIGVFGFVYEAANFASLFIGGRHLWQDDDAYVRRAAARLGLAIEVHEGSARATDAALRNILASGRPAIAFVEAGLLPNRLMPQELLGGGYHLVTVYEMDADRVLIGDLGTAPLTVPVAAFAAARSRIRKNKNRVLAMANARDSLDLAAAARDAIAASLASLDGADAIGSSARNFSLGALADLARRIAGTGRDSWAVALPPGPRLWSVLTMLLEFVELRTSGLCRPLFADFLAEIGDLVPGADSLADGYRVLGREWTGLAEAALPEDVPAFRRTRRLRAERAALRSTGDPLQAAALAAVEEKLRAVDAEVADCFPLDEGQCATLRTALHDRVLALHANELKMQQELRQLMRD